MSIKYRPEIDGLRAIAVLAVVFYHAEFLFMGAKPFQGGYIGVDVFFVISGYLITSIILKDLSSNQFSFLKFYERRIRRILPALFTVMLSSVPFAWIYMSPKAMTEYAGSIISALLFSSNFWFYSADNYWAESSALKPFLHTWSLGIEEQFYIIFPVILILIWRFARNYMTSCFVILFLFSLLLADFESLRHPQFTFFLLPARAWELLAGVILAKLELKSGRRSYPVLVSTMPAIGLCLIIYSIAFFNDTTRHPSFITLIPIVGTMLLIWFCKNGEMISSVLGSRALVAVGLVSYSFYLWHQPVFSFIRIYNGKLDQYDKLTCIMLSFALSIVTYFFIERPCRKMHQISLKTFMFGIKVSFFILLSGQAYIYTNKGFPDRFPFSKNLWETLQESGYEKICKVSGDEEELFKNRYCKIGDINSIPKFLLIGDSHALSMLNLFNRLALQQKKGGLFLFRSGCPPLLNVYVNRGSSSAKKCIKMNNEAFQMAKDGKISHLFFIARWDYYIDTPDTDSHQHIRAASDKNEFSSKTSSLVFNEKFIETLNIYGNTNTKIIIMLQVPHQNEHPMDIYKNAYSGKKNRIEIELTSHSVSIEDHIKRQAVPNKIIVEASKKFKNVFIIDPTKVLCLEKCLVGDMNHSFYFDKDHLSGVGADKLASLFENFF